MREGHSGLVYRHGFPTSSAAKPDRSSTVAGHPQEHQRGANLADALEKAAAGKPHKLALVACRQPSLIVGRHGCPLIAQTLHGHGNAICWVTQAGARHEDASQPQRCPAASCARKICHIALAVAELPLKLGLVCSSGSVRAKAGAVSPIATTGVMAECGRGEISSVRP